MQIAGALRARILSGELAPGEKLPPEHELQEAYGVSRDTLRKALQMLRNQGWVSSARGRAWWVRTRAPRLSIRPEQLQDLGKGEEAELRVTPGLASLDVASRLELREGEPVLVQRQRVLANKQPVRVATSYLPLQLARRAGEQAESTPAGVRARLEELGYQVSRFTDQLVARMPLPDEAKDLGLDEGTPVLQVARTTYTDSGQPIEATDVILRADRYELPYEQQAGQRVSLVTTAGALLSEMIRTVREARDCLVVVGSRARDPSYLEEIERTLQARPRLVHYRLLIGPPYRQVLKDHLLRLLELRDPEDRSLGMKTLYMGMVDDPREPERFFVASERRAVAILPSVTTAGNFDTGVVLLDPRHAQGLVQHAKQLYAGTKRLETRTAVEELTVQR